MTRVIAAHICPQRQRFFEGANMAAEIINPRVVDHFPVNNRVLRAEAILGDIYRNIAIARLNHHNAVS